METPLLDEATRNISLYARATCADLDLYAAVDWQINQMGQSERDELCSELRAAEYRIPEHFGAGIPTADCTLAQLESAFMRCALQNEITKLFRPRDGESTADVMARLPT